MKIAGYDAKLYEKSIVINGSTIFYGRKPEPRDIDVLQRLLLEAKKEGRNSMRKQFRRIMVDEWN